MPEALKTSFVSSHRGTTPEDIFTVEPLGFVINNLLASQKPGVTLETFLELSDGSRWNFTQIPEEWKNMPAPQIPGLMGITITVSAYIQCLPSSVGLLHCCISRWIIRRSCLCF